MTRHSLDTPQFYLTAPAPCPYLEGRKERKVFTHLVGERAAEINDMLTQGGFRRSQNIAYRPACEECRIIRNNRDLHGQQMPASPTSEQYSLFRQYLDDRHTSGGMADMTAFDYAMMVEDTHVNTILVEYRRRGPDTAINGRGTGPLRGVALTDVLGNGLSMVYSFYDTSEASRSLGTWMILDHVERARKMGLPYVYLGYWVRGSRKMEYKTRFQPQEHLTMTGWQRMAPGRD
jgi:arginyl-tRNA--protein-N-Asp/Glu arginylyltransferase